MSQLRLHATLPGILFGKQVESVNVTLYDVGTRVWSVWTRLHEKGT